MKSSRLTLDIISILTSVFASLFFVFPIWHFTSTTTYDGDTTLLTTNKVNLFDRESLKIISELYKTHDKDINPIFAYIFEYMSLVTISLVLIFTFFTLLSMSKKLNTSNKLFKISKIISIAIVISSIISLVSALIFTTLSEQIITQNSLLTYKLSINITSGIFIFSIFTIFSGFVGFIANNIKSNEID